MKSYDIFFLLFTIISFGGCEIVQETTFEEDGSGHYSQKIDLSAMVEKGLFLTGKIKNACQIFRY